MKLQGWISILTFAVTGLSQASEKVAGKIDSLGYIPGANGGSFQIIYHGDANFRFYQIQNQKRLVLVADHLELPAQLTKAIDSSSKDGPVIQITPYNAATAEGPSAKFVMQLRKGVEATPVDVPGKFVLSLSSSLDSNREAVREPRKSNRNFFVPAAWVEGGAENLQGKVPAKTGNSDCINSVSSAVERENQTAKKLIEVLNSENENKEYFGDPVDFVSVDASIHDVFQLVGEASGLNFITDSDVQAKSSYSLTKISWDHLLDLALQQAQLKATAVGNVIRITTLKKFSDEQEERKKLISLEKKLEPVVMAVVPLSFAKAGTLKDMITKLLIFDDSKGNTISEKKGDVTTTKTSKDDTLSEAFKRGALEIDDRSNSLVITNTKEAVERIRRLIKQLDVPQPQVLVDAKIVLANESFSRDLSMRFGAGANRGDTVIGGHDFTQANFSSPKGGALPGTAIDQKSFPLTFAIGTVNQGALNLALSLAETTDMSKTIASPRIITQNNVAATISDGKKVPVPTAGSATTAGGVTFVDISVSLTVTPQVTSSGYVLLDSSITHAIPEGASGGSSSKSIKNSVMVESGGTLVLGGVYTVTNTRVVSGIPVLKDLPFIGPLFQDTNTRGSGKTEMMVFLSPQVIEASRFQDAAPERK